MPTPALDMVYFTCEVDYDVMLNVLDLEHFTCEVDYDVMLNA